MEAERPFRNILRDLFPFLLLQSSSKLLPLPLLPSNEDPILASRFEDGTTGEKAGTAIAIYCKVGKKKGDFDLKKGWKAPFFQPTTVGRSKRGGEGCTLRYCTTILVNFLTFF